MRRGKAAPSRSQQALDGRTYTGPTRPSIIRRGKAAPSQSRQALDGRTYTGPTRPSITRRGRATSRPRLERSEEHTSELQSLMRISYAVFCLKKKITKLVNKEKSQIHKREN